METPDHADPAFRPVLTLRNTVKVVKLLKNKDGKGLSSRKLSIQPKVGDDLIVFHRREGSTDRLGKVEFTGIVPGLAYHISEIVDHGKPAARFKFQTISTTRTLVLAPAEHK